MGVIGFDSIKVDFVCGILQVFNEVRNISNVNQNHIFVQPNLESLLKCLRFSITAIWQLLLVDNFQLKFKVFNLVVLLLNFVSSISEVIKVDTDFGVSLRTSAPYDFIRIVWAIFTVLCVLIMHTFDLVLGNISSTNTITSRSDRRLDILLKLRREYAGGILIFLLWLIREIIFNIKCEVVCIVGVAVITIGALFNLKVKLSQNFVLAADKMLNDVNRWKSTIWELLEMQQSLVGNEIRLEDFLV